LRAPTATVVCGDADLAQRIERVICARNTGCRCRHTSAGRLALAKLEADAPDVVIVGADLPDMGADAFLTELRSLRAGVPIPTLVVAAPDCTDPMRDALYAAGADDILTLPVSDDDLSARLAILLRLKHAEDRVRANRARIRALSSEQAALLRQTEERFRALAQYSTEGVAVATAEGVLKYITPAMEKILGWTAQEAEGVSIWLAVHPGDRPRLRAAWKSLLGSPMAATAVEARVGGKATGWCWLQVVASNQLHIPGVHGVVLNCHDIRDRRRISDALEASRSRYRRFVETTHEGIWATDVEERTTFVNDRLAQMLGYSAPELLGKPVDDLLVPEDRETYLERVARRARGEMETYEHRSLRKDGSVLWTLVSASPMLDHAGEFSGAFAMLTDISEQKRVDQELRDALGRFEALIEATPLVAVQGMDRRGIVTLWNRACEQIYGFPREEALGKRVQALLLDPADRTEFEAVLDDVWRTGAPTQPAEWRIKTPEGKRLWVYSTMVPVRTAGEVSCVYCMDVDITDRHEARAALVASERELKQFNTELEARVIERTQALQDAVDELDAFAYSVTHDLRAPLRAVTGFAGALEEDFGVSLADEARRYLHHITDNVRRMDRLIRDLLDFSRCARREMDLRPLDMNEVVRLSLADQDQESLSRCDVVLGDLPGIMGDRGLMIQVLANLLSNAVKYSRTSEKPRIEVFGEDDGERWVTYSVRDNGVGYDSRYADKLFGVFQRLHNESEFEGTGVGLAIVQRIVRRHDGDVRAESELGKGATFSFTAPRARASGEGDGTDGTYGTHGAA